MRISPRSRTRPSPQQDQVPLSSEAAAEMSGRGRSEIRDRAVQRIVEAAAREVEGVAPPGDGSARGTRTGDRTGSRRGSRTGSGTAVATGAGAITGAVGDALSRDYPRVQCEVAGHRVRVRVDVVTLWPYAAAEVAAAVRDHIGERLRVLAGMSMDSIHVTVAKVVLPTTTTPRRRVL